MDVKCDYRLTRSFFVSISALIIFFLSRFDNVSSEKIQYIFLGLIATVGLSHGGLDWLLASRRGFRKHVRATICFVLVYVIIMVMTLFIWLLSASLGLITFLLIAVHHFAGDWKDEICRVKALVMALAVVSLPTLSFYQEVMALFSLLVPHNVAVSLANLLQLCGITSFVIVMILACYQVIGMHQRWLGFEILALLVSGICLPPLIYFAIYFCLLHSPKHWFTMRRLGCYQHFHQGLWSVICPTVVCIIAGLIVSSTASAATFSEALIRTIFIGLAALTVPHWLLVDIYPRVNQL